MLNNINFHIPVNSQLVIFALFLVLAIWLVFTIIIRYHWKSYGTNGVEVFTMNFMYLIGSAVIGGLMIILAILYISSST